MELEYWHKRSKEDMDHIVQALNYNMSLLVGCCGVVMTYQDALMNAKRIGIDPKSIIDGDEALKVNVHYEYGLAIIRKLYDFFFFDKCFKGKFSDLIDGHTKGANYFIRNSDIYAEFLFRNGFQWDEIKKDHKISLTKFEHNISKDDINKGVMHLTFQEKKERKYLNTVFGLLNLYKLYQDNVDYRFKFEFTILYVFRN